MQRGIPPKSGYFKAVGWFNVQTVADRHKNATLAKALALAMSFVEMLTSVTLNDLEPPTIEGFSDFCDFWLQKSELRLDE